MGTVKLKVPYMVGPKPGYYWQPVAAIRELGFNPEALGTDPIKAATRAEELNRQVAAAKRRRDEEEVCAAERYEGTFQHLADIYRGDEGRGIKPTEEWEDLAPKSKLDYGRHIDAIVGQWGDQPVAATSMEAVRELRDAKKGSPWEANYLIRVMRILLNHAVARKSIFGLQSNPAVNVKLFGKKRGVSARRRHWDDDAEALFLERARELDWEVYVGYHLLVYTGQRPSDVMAMRESDDDGVRIRVVEQQKTGAGVLIRKHQVLAAVLAEHRQHRKAAGRVGGTILQTEHGRQFKMRYFSERWNAVVGAVRAPCLLTAIAGDPELAERWARFAAVKEGSESGLRRLESGAWPEALGTQELRDRWHAALKAAPLHNLQRRDLRRTSVIRLAEADCTVPQIASITGHSLKQVEGILQTYWVRTAPQADAAIAKLEAHRPGGRKANGVGNALLEGIGKASDAD
jgi:integrase